jgi:hypothetical protein
MTTKSIALVLFFVSLAIAGFPVDFDSLSPRGDGEPFWLEPGLYYADISTRTDLNSSYLELQIYPERADVDCFYSVWFNDDKVSYGVFNSATSSVIPILPGTFPVTETEEETVYVSVMTSNCYLGRFAVPYKIGDNGKALYLQDIHPITQEDRTFTTDTVESGNYYPGRLNGGADYDDVLSWNTANLYSTGLCKFSSQACTASGTVSGFWMPSYFGYIPIQVDWSDATFYDATEGQVVIENSGWYGSGFVNYYYLCNSSSSCSDETGYDILDDITVGINDYSVDGAADYFNDYTKRAFSPALGEVYGRVLQSALNSSRYFYRTYYSFTPNRNEYDPTVAIYYSPNQVVFPYLKIWSIGTNDTMHVLADLRGGANTDCVLENGDDGRTANVDNGYASYGLRSYIILNLDQRWPNVYPSFHPSDQNYGNDQAFFYCAQAPAGSDLTCEQTHAQFNSVELKVGEVIETDPVSVTQISLPYGGLINPVTFDLGMPFVYGVGCGGPNPSDPLAFEAYNFALNQGSAFNILVNDNEVGSVEQFFFKRFDRNLIGGFGVEGFQLGVSDDISIKYSSHPDFSITAPAYIQINAFDAPKCDDSQCEHDGLCEDPFVSDACSCSPAYMGQNCSDLVPFCFNTTTENCVNGVCRENENRSIGQDSHGLEIFVYQATYCDCEGSAGQFNTADFRGEYCEITPPCDLQPCLNGGECINGEGYDFTCDCTGSGPSPNSTLPYIGDLCETPQTTVCDVNPCENGGFCTVNPRRNGGYACGCVNDWTGDTCAIAPATACDSNPGLCEPYGICNPSPNPNLAVPYAQCICLFGYSGDTCETAPAACTSQGVECQNGGSCIGFNGDSLNAVGCLCVEPWVGQNCQWNSSSTSTNFD